MMMMMMLQFDAGLVRYFLPPSIADSRNSITLSTYHEVLLISYYSMTTSCPASLVLNPIERRLPLLSSIFISPPPPTRHRVGVYGVQ